VDLRAAHLDRDLEPLLLVEAGGLGLIEAAMLGLRVPAGEEGDLVCGRRRAGDQGERRGGSEACDAGAGHGCVLSMMTCEGPKRSALIGIVLTSICAEPRVIKASNFASSDAFEASLPRP